MPILHLIILAVVQGITEFLPVSSSGHLILVPQVTGQADQGLLIDVAVHVGTLGAVMLYFQGDVRRATAGLLQLRRGRPKSQEAWLALCLIIATIPVVVAGALLHLTGLDEMFRSVAVVGWATLVFGVLLYAADKLGHETRAAEGWTLKHAAIMGLYQVLALIPGTSRSGITITGARHLGYKRVDAARLAMLMSIPTIMASGALLGIEAVAEANAAGLRDAGLAAVIALAAALAALHLMMRLLTRLTFTPYVIYRMILGVTLLAVAYG